MAETQPKKLRGHVKERFATYITAALGLVAGLAWNDAIKSFIELVFPLKQNSVTAKFIYAVIITVIVVIIANYIVSLLKDKE